MTASNFPACLEVVLQSEGGFSDDPQDPGGVTNLGVTLHTWSGYVGHTATIAEMQALTPADVGRFYHSEYWNACDCDLLPAGVDLMVFDEAVNAGPWRARRSLQTAAGATADGSIGPATEAAVKAAAPATLIVAIAANRQALYRSLPTFPRFGDGWLARVERTQTTALAMAHGATA